MNSIQALPLCPKCRVALGPGFFNREHLSPCPACSTLLQVDVFKALFRRETVATPSETSLVEGESTCFYHNGKKAAVVCDGCGRFLCALCDCQLAGCHYCPPCLELGAKKRNIEQLETSRPLHARQALMLSILPFFVTGLAALYLAIRHWKSPGSLVTPRRWLMPLALAFAIIQTLAFGALIIALFTT